MAEMVDRADLTRVSVYEIPGISESLANRLNELNIMSVQDVMDAMVAHRGRLYELSTPAILIGQKESAMVGDAVLDIADVPDAFRQRFARTASTAPAAPATPSAAPAAAPGATAPVTGVRNLLNGLRGKPKNS